MSDFSEEHYRQKYLKYKKKYLQLVEQYGGQLGGNCSNPSTHPVECGCKGAADQCGGATWSEESHGNKEVDVEGKKYPPCFSISGPSRAMYDEIKNLNLSDKYYELFNLHSILLCTERDVRDLGKKCGPSMDVRMKELNSSAANKANQSVVDLFKSIKRDKVLEKMEQNKHPVDLQLIGMLNTVVEKVHKHVKSIANEANVNQEMAENIKKLNEIFLKVHVKSIARSCNPLKGTYDKSKSKPKTVTAKKVTSKKPNAKKVSAKKVSSKKKAPAKKTASKKKASKKKAAPKKKASKKK
jgi:hypothetical protein